MKKLLNSVSRMNAAALILVAALATLLIELFFFNFSFFSWHFKDFPRRELDLSAYDSFNGEAIPLLPDQPTFAFNDLDLPVRSVTVRTAGPARLLSGNIGICDEANAYQTVGAGHFQVNPGGFENTFTVRINSRGNLTRLRVTFTDDKLSEPVFILSVVLNERTPLKLHWLRIFLIFSVLSLSLCSLRYKLYRETYCPDKKSHRLMNLGVLLFCLGVSALILYGADPNHALLKPYPTPEELCSPEKVVDAYMQQLDAFKKGQLELDLDVNPQLEQLDNVYDRTERDKKDVFYHWDRAYYNGKYYSYFGLAPLFMTYYPVYWLTRMLPTELFSSTLLAVFAIFAIFAAIQGLLRLFCLRPNLLLFLVGEAAVVAGSFLYMIQASFTFYYLPLLAAVGWMAVFIAASSFAYQTKVGWKRGFLFALAGLAVVMLVLSRPTYLLLAVAFAAPMYLSLLFSKQRKPREKLESALSFLIPVCLGGAAIMYYNYVRFGSVTEFGTSYQMTVSDIRYNRVSLSLHHLAAMTYHFFLEPFVHTEFFPFLRFTREKCLDFGNFMYQEYSVGLFQMPLNLGIFLAGFTLCKPSGTKKGASLQNGRSRLQKATYLSLILGLPTLGYLDYLLGGIHIRYVCDLSLTLALLAFLLVLEHVHYDTAKTARILYAIVLFLLFVTIGRGLLTIFSNEKNDILLSNPDFYLKIARMFRFS